MSDLRRFCMDLLHADTEEDVIRLLKQRGYWDDARAWRCYGDRDSNYATIGNQQSRPEAALVEKLVNSVDARLMDECLKRGIDPAGPRAPTSIRQAVARFIEGKELNGDIGGTVRTWHSQKQLEESQFITLAATGGRQTPSLTIVDCGEGQSPDDLPNTFLSIDKKNKLRIPFVQGKFNMGGTGALKFCGHESLQLLISRRDPAVVQASHEKEKRSNEWGFTIVRRDRPRMGSGEVRNSVYRYLAPNGMDMNPEGGNVLSFSSDCLPLMPDKNLAYVRNITFGSCVKLYAYDMKGFRSHILMPNGLLTRLEVLLPEVALPIRLHECRDFGGKAGGSFANTLVGLTARLDHNLYGNLEPGYPDSVPLTVRGQNMLARIYAFRDDKALSYTTNEGVVFTINGQTHGTLPRTLFGRKSVNMGRLADSLLVIVDCSELTADSREDLFMNSRDRLTNGELRHALEDELQDLIKHHQGLRELRDRRQREEVAERLEDARPLEDVIQSILKTSPTLSRLFLRGQRLSKPHKDAGPGNEAEGGGGGKGGSGAFVPKQHPTFFQFHERKHGETLVRNCELGRRCRLKFDTDVVNDYFIRDSNRGRYHVNVLEGALENEELNSSLTLHNGIANWSITLPEERLTAGDEITIECTVSDDVIPDSLVNVAKIKVKLKTSTGGGSGERESRHGESDSDGGGDGGVGMGGKKGRDLEAESGIKLPDIKKVKKAQWATYQFDEKSACKIIVDASGEGDQEESTYTFYINVDNLYLRTDMKGDEASAALRQAKFIYANVLVGLALLHDERSKPKVPKDGSDETSEMTIEKVVERTTRALGPFLIPMIDYLGALSQEDAGQLARIGDDE